MKYPTTSFIVFTFLQIITFCIGALVAGMMMGVLFVAQNESDMNISSTFIIYGGCTALLSILLLILSAIAYGGLSREKNWGRTLGIIVAILALIEFPTGTGFGIYWLVRFFKRT